MIRLVVFIVGLQLSGCAAMEHNRIVAEQRAQEEKQGIPTYGVDNRNPPLVDALHGAAWWTGTDKIKDALQ